MVGAGLGASGPVRESISELDLASSAGLARELAASFMRKVASCSYESFIRREMTSCASSGENSYDMMELNTLHRPAPSCSSTPKICICAPYPEGFGNFRRHARRQKGFPCARLVKRRGPSLSATSFHGVTGSCFSISSPEMQPRLPAPPRRTAALRAGSAERKRRRS